MVDPHFSVVTVSYNQADFIEKTLQSVMEQSYDAYEHIVVDGDSTDGTIDILREYAEKYNLRWVSEPDRGQSHALNKGIEMAEGGWISFQMADDYYLPGAFETIAAAIDQHPNADTVYGDVIHVDAEGNEIGRTFNIPPSRFINKYWSLYSNLQSMFFREDVFNRIGNFDENLKYTMDADLFWRLLDADVTQIHVPDFVGAFREHKNAKTPSRSAETARAEWDAIYGDYYESVERYVPIAMLRWAAKGAKAVQLARIRRLESFSHNLRHTLVFKSRVGNV